MSNPLPSQRKSRRNPGEANTSWNTWQPGSGRKGYSPDWERAERINRWTQEIRKERQERNDKANQNG